MMLCQIFTVAVFTSCLFWGVLSSVLPLGRKNHAQLNSSKMADLTILLLCIEDSQGQQTGRLD